MGAAYEIVGREEARGVGSAAESIRKANRAIRGLRALAAHAVATLEPRRAPDLDFQHFDFGFGDGDFNRGRAGGVGIDPDILDQLFQQVAGAGRSQTPARRGCQRRRHGSLGSGGNGRFGPRELADRQDA